MDINVDGTNSVSNTLTVKYWKDDTVDAWTDISASDGTDSGASLGQDGQVTWTVPTDWKAADLLTIGDADKDVGGLYVGQDDIYWTRWEWDVALDTQVTLLHMLALNRSTTYGELLEGQVFSRKLQVGIGDYSCVEVLTDAGTANLVVNAATLADGRFI